MVGTFFLPAPTFVGSTTLPTLTFLPGIPALYLLHLYILQVEEFSLNCTEAQQKRQRRPSDSIMSVGIILSLVFPAISNALINEDKSKDAPLGNCPIIEGCTATKIPLTPTKTSILVLKTLLMTVVVVMVIGAKRR